MQRERQRVAAAAGANVKPHVIGPGQGEQRIERRIVGPVRIDTKAMGRGGIEVGRIGFLARTVDLLLVGDYGRAPGVSQFRG